jgi:hypothetical protein
VRFGAVPSVRYKFFVDCRIATTVTVAVLAVLDDDRLELTNRFGLDLFAMRFNVSEIWIVTSSWLEEVDLLKSREGKGIIQCVIVVDAPM